MLKAKESRKLAWGKLKGKWGAFAVCTLIYFLLLLACSLLTTIILGPIATLLISGPLILGYSMVAINVSHRKSISEGQIFHGFKYFGSSLALYICNNIFIFLWCLLLIIPGIIKSFSYSMSFFVLADNPALSSGEARRKSIEIMKGNKFRFFCLNLSFIGWILLCTLTLGILYFWIYPYIFTAQAEFYRDLISESNDKIMYDDFSSPNLEEDKKEEKSDSLNPYF